MAAKTDRVALVTGASSGIGEAAAHALVGAGFTVYGTSRRATTGEKRGEVVFLPLDVTDDESVADAVREVLDRSGRIDVLVNNAGLGSPAPPRRAPSRRPERVRDQRLRLDAHDQGRTAAHARAAERTRHQRRRRRSHSRALHGVVRLESTRSRATPSPWTTRCASTASAFCWSSRVQQEHASKRSCCSGQPTAGLRPTTQDRRSHAGGRDEDRERAVIAARPSSRPQPTQNQSCGTRRVRRPAASASPTATRPGADLRQADPQAQPTARLIGITPARSSPRTSGCKRERSAASDGSWATVGLTGREPAGQAAITYEPLRKPKTPTSCSRGRPRALLCPPELAVLTTPQCPDVPLALQGGDAADLTPSQPPVGRFDGHEWGDLMVTHGEKRWLPVGNFVAASREKPIAIDSSSDAARGEPPSHHESECGDGRDGRMRLVLRRVAEQCSHVARHEARAATNAGRGRVRARALVFATCRFGHAVGLEVVVTVDSSALLLFWRGYADPAPQARLAPRFECARGISAEIAPDPQFAKLETHRVVG